MKKELDHTFVICAYKEVPYLEECVESLLNQTVKSEVIISTSTPNDYIKGVAKKYKVKLAINKGKSGHIEDFCFAYKQANTKYITLCHQDDVYLPDFSLKVVNKMNDYKNPLISFTNYSELKGGKVISTNKVLRVKHFMNYPFSIKLLAGRKWLKRRVLSLGCPICAPTVTYNKELIKEPIIKSSLKSNIDWDTWIYFASLDGSFVYVKDRLLNHRIHDLSTTSAVLANDVKHEEDQLIFSRFWPKWMVKILMRVYGTSEVDYKLEKEEK